MFCHAADLCGCGLESGRDTEFLKDASCWRWLIVNRLPFVMGRMANPRDSGGQQRLLDTEAPVKGIRRCARCERLTVSHGHVGPV